MEYFKQIFIKLLEYLKITGKDADDMTKDFLEQVNARFVEEFLAVKLPKEQFDAKVEEYKKALAENRITDLQNDFKNFLQNPNEIGEAYAQAFSNHILAFIAEMQAEGEIKPEQIADIRNLLENTVKSVNLQFKVEVSQKEGKIEDVLKNIAS